MGDVHEVGEVQRLRCMCEEDRTCLCGEKVTGRSCGGSSLVSCPSCGRQYLITGQLNNTGHVQFSDLPVVPRKQGGR